MKIGLLGDFMNPRENPYLAQLVAISARGTQGVKKTDRMVLRKPPRPFCSKFYSAAPRTFNFEPVIGYIKKWRLGPGEHHADHLFITDTGLWLWCRLRRRSEPQLSVVNRRAKRSYVSV